MTPPYLTYRDAARLLGLARPDGHPDTLAIERLVAERKLRTIDLLFAGGADDRLIAGPSFDAYRDELYPPQQKPDPC